MYKNLLILFLIKLIYGLTISFSLAADLPSGSRDHQHIIEAAQQEVEEKPEQAISLLLDLLGTIQQEKEPLIASEAHGILGDAYYYLDNFELSAHHYQKAVEINLLSDNHKTDRQITLLGYLGFVYDLMEQPLIALDYYERALVIARELGNKKEIATNLANMGKIQTIQGFYEEALANMEEALAIDRAIGDESVIATDLNTIARIYEAWGMFDKAAEYLQQALEINQKLGQEDKVAIRLSGLGLVYKAWGKYPEALDYFQQALAIDKKLKNTDKVALRQVNIGSTYLEMGMVDKAIVFLKLGLEFFEDKRMISYAASTLNDLGRGYLLKKEYLQAESAFLQAIEYSHPGHLNRFTMTSLQQLAQLYRMTAKHDKAFQYLNDYHLLKDSLFNAQSQKKLLEFQARYELDNRQQENEILKREQEIADRRQTIIILSSSLAILFLGTVLLALMIRMKTSQNRRLKTEKENQALRIELEQRSRELTYNAMCIVKKNETLARMIEAVDNAIVSHKDHQQLKNIINNVQREEHDKSWDEFELRFIQTHQGFYDTLQERFPDLTPNERKLCAFLRLNMSTKEIAAITHQSVNSINVARTRLRKKLGIDSSDENLVGFLHSL
jgi:tetratricopeptide (TPR) repeat protein